MSPQQDETAQACEGVVEDGSKVSTSHQQCTAMAKVRHTLHINHLLEASMISQQELKELFDLKKNKERRTRVATEAEKRYKTLHEILLARAKKEPLEAGEHTAGIEKYVQFISPYKTICEQTLPADIIAAKVKQLGYEDRERLIVTKTLKVVEK